MSSNVDFVKSMYDAFARADVPAVLGGLDAQVQWSEAENFLYARDTPYVGPQEVLMNVFMKLATEWSDVTVVPERYVDGGDTVIAFGRYRGSFKATGAAVNAQFAHVFEIANGKVVSFQQYTDTFQFKKAAGA